jgi:UDP-N-acetylmuramyl pentapeptide synthase
VLGLPNAWNNPIRWVRNIIDGLLLALFSSDYPAVLIVEAGVDHPGDMERLTRWITPDIVVLTRLPDVPVHVEFFKSPEAVADEKMKLVAALSTRGTLIYNADDTRIINRLAEVRQRTIGFSRYLESEFRFANDRVVYEDDVPVRTDCTLTHGGSSYALSITGTVGVQHAYAYAAAIATASVLGVAVETAVVNMREHMPPRGRMRIIPGVKGSTIIDDTYNASPIAVEQALEALRDMKLATRKIAVLGDMLELGRYSAEEHTRIGTLVPSAADILLTVGVRARAVAEAALRTGMPESQVFQYEDTIRAGTELQAMLQSGDVVLVKASQGIRAEKIVEEVMANPDTASDILVRQGIEWKQRE